MIKLDCAIIGGGIAGLWTAIRLKQLGYSVLVFENQALGSGQSINAQGIIHGGTKYALTGLLNKSALSIAEMPDIWSNALKGQGEIDLKNTRILAKSQYFWSNGSLFSEFGTFMASKVLNAKSALLKPEDPDFPELLRHSDFKGLVYCLPEIILDVPSLFQNLIQHLAGNLLKIDSVEITGPGELKIVGTAGQEMRIQAQAIIASAGIQNQKLTQPWGMQAMQTRPLRMAAIKSKYLIPFWGHAIGLDKNPLLTISSHQNPLGEWIWYLGGNLAELGAKQTEEQHIQNTLNTLKTIFPWQDWKNLEIKSIYLERAEPKQFLLQKPDEAFAEYKDRLILAWPTKLAFAPQLAQKIIQILQKKIKPLHSFLMPSTEYPQPEIAIPLWYF
ncbi:MAG: FAD-dependent oxidoreductase [Gammaproteobacteria bacterium]